MWGWSSPQVRCGRRDFGPVWGVGTVALLCVGGGVGWSYGIIRGHPCMHKPQHTPQSRTLPNFFFRQYDWGGRIFRRCDSLNIRRCDYYGTCHIFRRCDSKPLRSVIPMTHEHTWANNGTIEGDHLFSCQEVGRFRVAKSSGRENAIEILLST